MRRLSLWTKTNPRSRSQPGLRLLFALPALLLAFGPAALRAASFTASLDRDTVTVGESATLTLRFEGGEPKSMPTLPALPGLQVANGGSSQNISIVNGAMSASILQTFSLTPTQPGVYTIPALHAEIGGQVLATQPLRLTAVKAPASATNSAGQQLAFFKIFLPKKEVYVGEILAVQFQVYVREGLANTEAILQSFDQYGGCPLKAEGFSIIKTAHARRRRAQVGNAVYGVATLVTSLSPVKTGTLKIGSMDVPLTLQIPLPNQPRRDPFDPFGFFRQTPVREQRVALSAPPETLTALPLPQENVPADFNGAVGNYSMTVNAGPTNVAAGDPVTVRIQLSGRGAFDSLTLPAQSAWGEFKTYPPTTKVETTDALGLQGTKTFEQVVVPQSADIKALPPVSFSFFDPDQKHYRTLSHPAIPLVVRPGGSTPEPTVAAAAPAAQDNPPSHQDIVHIKPRLGVVAEIGPPLILRPWFVGLQAFPLFAWLSAVVWRRRTERLANNPRLRRRRQVAQIIRQGLLELHQLAAANKSDEFFATLFRLLQEQLGERLDLPASAITEAVLEERLSPRGVPEATLASLHSLFQICNLARYAPIKTSRELAAIIPGFEAAMHAVQELRL